MRRLTKWVGLVACTASLGLGALAFTPTPAGAGTQSCPADAGNGAFVRFTYLMILGRCPDTDGYTYWKGRLDGGMDRWMFVEAVDMSTENVVNNNVVEIFQELLGRAPTADETAKWSDFIRTNHADAGFIASLAASDEFYGTVPGETSAEKDQAWLGFAYNGILDRDPDDGGAAYYTAMFGTASTRDTRYNVAMQMEHSLENAQGWTGAVYFAGLNRPPDDAGFQYWITWLTGPGNWHTFQMWTHILASDEAYGLAQDQPSTPADKPVAPRPFKITR